MKKNKLLVVIFSLFCLFILFGCSNNEHKLKDNKFEAVSNANPEDGIQEQKAESHRSLQFSIHADNHLIPSITALYKAYYPHEEPNFVNIDGDLLVTRSPQDQPGRPGVYATYLPDSVLIPKSDASELNKFIQFAISAGGQQALINAGYLPEEILINDQDGNQITIPQPVERVISAYGPTSAMIYGVGASDRLVAASYLGARDPQGAGAMERIDPRFQNLVSDDIFSQNVFDIEEAALLDPDLIIASSRSTWVGAASQLGVDIFLIEAENANQLKEAILLIGKLFGPHTTAQAKAWVEYYDWVSDTINIYLENQITFDHLDVLFTGTDPLRIASGDMFQTELIETAGGTSVSADLKGYWNDVNLEQVATWNPDIILVPPYGGASISAIIDNPEWKILPAVQNGDVYQMPKLVAPWDTPSPDSVLGIIWLANLFYSDFIELNCADQVNYFYNTFYYYPITNDEIASLCSIK